MGFYPKVVKDRICLFSAPFTPFLSVTFFYLGLYHSEYNGRFPNGFGESSLDGSAMSTQMLQLKKKKASGLVPLFYSMYYFNLHPMKMKCIISFFLLVFIMNRHIQNFYQGPSLRVLCCSWFSFLLLGGPAERQFFSLDAQIFGWKV